MTWNVFIARLSAVIAPFFGVWSLVSHRIILDIIFSVLLLPSISLLLHNNLDTCLIDTYLNRLVLRKKRLLGTDITEYRLSDIETIELRRNYGIPDTCFIAFILKPGRRETLTPYPVHNSKAREIIGHMKALLLG
jgi:hypothetical protein